MIIAIDGCSGVGKTFVASQLSALTRWPAILEGADGVFPDWVFESFMKPSMTERRTDWFIERCVTACIRARFMAAGERICFIDSGPLTSEAYTRVDAKKAKLPLKRKAGVLRRNAPDLSVLLVSDAKEIRSRILERDRSPEQSKSFIARAQAVQSKCIDLTEHYNTIVVHRDQYDFSRSRDLRALWDRIASHPAIGLLTAKTV